MENVLEKVSFDYFRGKPPAQFQHLTSLLEKFLQEKLLDQLFRKTLGRRDSPMPVQYRVAFLKFVLKHVEGIWTRRTESQNDARCLNGNSDCHSDNAEDEIPGIETWYTELERLSSSPPEPFFRFYELSSRKDRSDSMIKIYENEKAFVSNGTTGLMTWTASIQLGEWIISTRPLELSKVNWVMELGSGTGLLGISTLKGFPKVSKYIATDSSLTALRNCEENFLTNFPSESDMERISFEKIDWLEDIQKFKILVNESNAIYGAGLLLGADIVFDESLVPPLVSLISTFLENDAAICFLSCTLRNEKTIAVLQKELVQRGKRFDQAHSWESDDGSGLILQVR